jgi:enoyl-[acyl-carrier protein] reductase I
MLKGRSLLITGIASDDSIATATLRSALNAGARVRVTALARDLETARDVVSRIDSGVAVDALDLTDAEAVAEWTQARAAEGVVLDGALHAVAFAPRGALDGAFLAASDDDVTRAVRTSVFTYAVLAQMVTSLMSSRGASIVGLDFDAGGRAWPVYNWMGVCKAALRETSRYIARDLGPQGVRSNLVAAGPLVTRAASGIPRFELLTDAWEKTAPMKWDPADAAPVADVACFLMSDLARAITGEIIHVDGGFHAMATQRADVAT